MNSTDQPMTADQPATDMGAALAKRPAQSYVRPGKWEIISWVLLLLVNVLGLGLLIYVRMHMGQNARVSSLEFYLFSPNIPGEFYAGSYFEQYCFLLLGSWLVLLSWAIGRLPIWIELKWTGSLGFSLLVFFRHYDPLGLIDYWSSFSVADALPIPDYVWAHAGLSLAVTLLSTVWLWAVMSQRSMMARLGIALGISFALLAMVRTTGSFTDDPQNAFIWNQMFISIGLALVLRIVFQQQLIAPGTSSMQPQRGHQFGLFTFLIVITAVAIALNMARYFDLLNWPNEFRVRFALVAVIPALVGILTAMVCLTSKVRWVIIYSLALLAFAALTPLSSLLMPVIIWPSAGRINSFIQMVNSLVPIWTALTIVYTIPVAIMLRASGLRLKGS